MHVLRMYNAASTENNKGQNIHATMVLYMVRVTSKVQPVSLPLTHVASAISTLPKVKPNLFMIEPYAGQVAFSFSTCQRLAAVGSVTFASTASSPAHVSPRNKPCEYT